MKVTIEIDMVIDDAEDFVGVCRLVAHAADEFEIVSYVHDGVNNMPTVRIRGDREKLAEWVRENYDEQEFDIYVVGGEE